MRSRGCECFPRLTRPSILFGGRQGGRTEFAVPSPPQDSRQSRRDLLKKAAIGGGVAAAAWAAPTVSAVAAVDPAPQTDDLPADCIDTCFRGTQTSRVFHGGTCGSGWANSDCSGTAPAPNVLAVHAVSEADAIRKTGETCEGGFGWESVGGANCDLWFCFEASCLPG